MRTIDQRIIWLSGPRNFETTEAEENGVQESSTMGLKRMNS